MFLPGAMSRMNIYKRSRIIKSQDVSFVPSVAGVRADLPLCRSNSKTDRSDEITNNEEIERVLQETELKIAAAGKQAYEQGFSEGLKKGAETQKDEALALMNALHAVMEDVGSFKEKTIKASEKQMLDLCFSIAERIIHQEISMDKSVILSVLKAAIRDITERENIKIRLNPDDFKYIVEIKSDFINSMDGVGNIFFEEDGNIPRGGAILEAGSGEVDARISEQLKEVKAVMTELQAS